jgi:serine/threonine protein phosphatase PrpC
MGQKYGLIYEPEIKEIEIGKDLRYIVLGSDGLFDQVAPTEMANILNIQSQQQ